MKKILLVLTVLISTASMAQEFHRCATHKAIEFQESNNPGYKTKIEEEFQRAKQWSIDNQDRTDEILTIPVVVHIVHNTDAQNLHDSVINEQILSLNEDYGRMNADTVNMRAQFQSIVGDTRIRFELASTDPDGNPTTGITRTNTSTTSFGSIAMALGDMSEVENVKSSSNGGIDPWNQQKYLNIWVCNMSINFGGQETTALLGYATPPDGLSHWPAGAVDGLQDGVVVQYQCMGRNNPNPLTVPDQSGGSSTITVRGRTISHEVGHYLGLRHIWGDGDCNEQDGVDDTPNADAQSDFDCDDTKNTCVDAIGVLGDLPDMIENYMDYSAETCQNSFTRGQKDIMYGILNDERYYLVHDGDPLSIEEESVVFGVYPNPSEGIITLKTNVVDYKINVVTMDGKIVRQYNSVNQIDLTDMNKGIYFLNVIKENELLKTEKIVLQ